MWGEAKLDWQRRHILLVQGILSRDTFGRVFAALNQKQCEACSKRWMSGPCPALAGGRSWRLTAGPCVAHATRRARHYGSGLGMALGRVRTAEKSNEITVIPKRLDALQLKGRSSPSNAATTSAACRPMRHTSPMCVPIGTLRITSTDRSIWPLAKTSAGGAWITPRRTSRSSAASR
ncbi:transposase family protein [Burkholderia pyrrocinia]|uniref:transposase family protein n=1 Tax=Burkholderia pyrrocinia TaxID=60550 RepID=UPI001588A07A|nr:transposase family protein [Burkholderia pyrrocinia]